MNMVDVLSSTDPPRQIVVARITGHFEDVDTVSNDLIAYFKEQFNKFEVEENADDDEYTIGIYFTKKDPAIEILMKSILEEFDTVRFSINTLEQEHDGGTTNT